MADTKDAVTLPATRSIHENDCDQAEEEFVV